jgi:hypothetical protein
MYYLCCAYDKVSEWWMDTFHKKMKKFVCYGSFVLYVEKGEDIKRIRNHIKVIGGMDVISINGPTDAGIRKRKIDDFDIAVVRKCEKYLIFVSKPYYFNFIDYECMDEIFDETAGDIKEALDNYSEIWQPKIFDYELDDF